MEEEIETQGPRNTMVEIEKETEEINKKEREKNTKEQDIDKIDKEEGKKIKNISHVLTPNNLSLFSEKLETMKREEGKKKTINGPSALDENGEVYAPGILSVLFYLFSPFYLIYLYSLIYLLL